MFIGNSLIAWKSKKQDTMSCSSAESEYQAMSFSIKEVEWLVNLLASLNVLNVSLLISTAIPLRRFT